MHQWLFHFWQDLRQKNSQCPPAKLAFIRADLCHAVVVADKKQFSPLSFLPKNAKNCPKTAFFFSISGGTIFPYMAKKAPMSHLTPTPVHIFSPF